MSTKPSLRAVALASPVTSRELLSALLLGANLWVVGVGWPLLGTRPGGAKELGLAFAAPLPLLLGFALRGPRLIAALRPALWLVLYPVSICAAIAVRPERLNQTVYDPLTLVLLWLSLCAYGASAARLCVVRAPALPALHTALGNEAWDAPPADRGPLQRAFIAVCAAGAVALCIVAPSWGGQAALEQAWGDAALSGGVLTAVVGAALGVATLAVYLGNGLRGVAAAAEPQSDGALRAAWFLFLALLGAVTYYVVQN
jgi:hypothetical protein